MHVRTYNSIEEIAHSVSHGLGALGALVGTVFLVVTATRYGDIWRMIGGAIFGVTAMLLFATSSAYHGARNPRIKEILQKLDHSAIYLLIAGSYTAFTLSVMRNAWGFSLLAVVWALALFGITNEFKDRARSPLKSAALYLGMGWLCIVSAKQLFAGLTTTQLHWLIAGGVLYTAGVPFYIWKSRAYTHVIWHVFVLGGVLCHYRAVLSVMHIRTS